MKKQNEILIFTGPPANGKSTIGKLLEESGFCPHVEADDHISNAGKQALNDGTWNDTHRKEYMSSACQAAIEESKNNPRVAITDTLTFPWMRQFILETLRSDNRKNRLIFVKRELDTKQIMEIAQLRASQGHALEPAALINFREKFEPLDPIKEPHSVLENPGDGDLKKLLQLVINHINNL